MQGALKVSIAVMVVAGAAPASTSAQLLDVPPVQVPPVSVPPVTLPAPLPQVSTPPVSTPPVSVPGVRVDAPLPALPPAPHVPQVRAPVAAPAARAGARLRPPPAPQRLHLAKRCPPGPSPRPARRALPRRVADVSRARRRSAAGAACSARATGRERRLVRALSACVAGLPGRQERLLVMRYGVGPAAAHPDRAVAGALGLSPGEYTALRGRALRGVVHDARAGGCRRMRRRARPLPRSGTATSGQCRRSRAPGPSRRAMPR